MRISHIPLFATLLLLNGVTVRARSDSLLADPALMPKTAERIDFVGANTFSIEKWPNGRYLRSTPNRSASGLYQPVSVPSYVLKRVQWSWRVDQIQKNADVTKLDHEDFAAKVAFVFGKPTLWNRDVPTLAYVWTSTPVPNGTVLRSLRFSKLRYVQLHGPKENGVWRHETRNIIADFKSAFGHDPGPLRFIVIFNDNDQTGEPTSAVFGPIIGVKGR